MKNQLFFFMLIFVVTVPFIQGGRKVSDWEDVDSATRYYNDFVSEKQRLISDEESSNLNWVSDESEISERNAVEDSPEDSTSVIIKETDTPSPIKKREGAVFVNKVLRPMLVKKSTRPMLVRKDERPMFVRKDERPMFVRKDERQMFVRKDERPMLVRKDQRPILVRKDEKVMLVKKKRETDVY